MANRVWRHHLLLLLLASLAAGNLRLISTTEESSAPVSLPSMSPRPLSFPPAPYVILPPPVSSPAAQPQNLPSLPPPPPQPIIVSQPPPPLEKGFQEQQLNNIIDALIGAGDFAGWANILSAADPLMLPLTATLFIPDNDAIGHFPSSSSSSNFINFDPFIIPYHIIPQRLTFSDLQVFNPHVRLPTLLPSKTIIITNTSPSNFTVDDSPITYPDIFVNSDVAVHGIGAILDYTLYGDGLISPPDPIPRLTPPEAVEPSIFPGGETMDRGRSDAACLCADFPIIFSVVCAAVAFKLQRYHHSSMMGMIGKSRIRVAGF